MCAWEMEEKVCSHENICYFIVYNQVVLNVITFSLEAREVF